MTAILGQNANLDERKAVAMTLPNFLIIGAQKAGTTAIYDYLSQHPQVFTSELKEPGFFAFEGGRLSRGGMRRVAERVDLRAAELCRSPQCACRALQRT